MSQPIFHFCESQRLLHALNIPEIPRMKKKWEHTEVLFRYVYMCVLCMYVCMLFVINIQSSRILLTDTCIHHLFWLIFLPYLSSRAAYAYQSPACTLLPHPSSPLSTLMSLVFDHPLLSVCHKPPSSPLMILFLALWPMPTSSLILIDT